MNEVERVVALLASRGRHVPADDIARQLGGLEGLPPELAANALLRTYGLAPDGAEIPGFEPDRSPRDVVTSLLRDSRSNVLYVLVAAVVGLVPALAVPLLVRIFVDRYIVAQDPSWGIIVVVGLLVAGALAASVVWMQYAALRRLQMRMARSQMTAFTWRTITMRIPHLQQYGTGDVVGRLYAAEQFARRGGFYLPLALVNSLTALVFLVMIFLMDTIMGLTAVAVVVVALLITRSVLRRRDGAQRRFDSDLVRLTSYTSDVISAAESIKAAAWEQFAFVRWMAVRQRMAASSTRLGIENQYIWLVPVLAQALGLGAFLAIGVAQVFMGTVLLGTVVAAQAYMVLLLTSVQMLATFGILAQSITSLQKQFGPIMREPLDPELLTVSRQAHPEIPDRLGGAVSLHAVDFGYGDASKPLLKGLSLEVAPGRRVALVGPSGSGKTTIAKLIIGELLPWSGYVALDGVARLEVPRAARARDIAYVPQTSVLFPGTIRDNLTLWNDDISDDAVERAARDACIEDTILGRPGAYFHHVTSRDGGFSGGELQRLSIARALTGDPRIIVLDEATSALDPVVEADVEARLRARGVTAILVAHRLSTIRDADEILVVDAGRIVQRGTFTELAREGLFAELVRG